VTDVDDRSLAARFGFEPGDVVVGVNGRKIANVSALQDTLRKGSRVWNVVVDRGGSTLTLSVRN
jgi:S1-C subfamily serine protease